MSQEAEVPVHAHPVIIIAMATGVMDVRAKALNAALDYLTAATEMVCFVAHVKQLVWQTTATSWLVMNH